MRPKLVITITGWANSVVFAVNNNKDIERLAVDLIVKIGVNINSQSSDGIFCASANEA